jgi:lycopene cyclase domain-containing protein
VTGLGYTLPAVIAVVVVIALECKVFRTGLFRSPVYWSSMVIVIAFQILVDGWLTRADAAVVRYAEHHTLGIRFPWDIPVEDFLFGWAMVTAVLMLWQRSRQREERTADGKGTP